MRQYMEGEIKVLHGARSSLKQRGRVLKTWMLLIECLLKGPLTVKKITQQTNLSYRTVYRYLKVMRDVFPSKFRTVGKHPVKYWLD